MDSGALGKIYQDKEIIVKQGEQGDSIFVIQDGQVEIVNETDQGEVLLTLRGKGDLFGEMSIFDRAPRSATVRAIGEARILTIDKKHFIRRLSEDPSLVFHLVQKMSARIRELSSEVSYLRTEREGNYTQ